MKPAYIDVWSMRRLAAKLLHYIEKQRVSYDLAYQRSVSEDEFQVSKRVLYEAGRDFVTRYYTLAYLAREVFGGYWVKNKSRVLADLWVYYFGSRYMRPQDYKRESKKIARRSPGGRLPELNEVSDKLDGYSRVGFELSYPAWLVRDLSAATGLEEARRILDSLNKGRRWLRVNTTKTDVESAIEALGAEGVRVRKHDKLEYMLLVEYSPKPISHLRAVNSGYVVPQDLASAIVVEELVGELSRGALLLDMCSAPGGKMSLCVQRVPGLIAVGCDLSIKRLGVEASLLGRLGHRLETVSLVRCDSRVLNVARRVDAILLDAPCSGSGSIGRDPAIKISLGRRGKLEYYVDLQKSLLRNALRMQSRLVLYSTCSILPEEGEEVLLSLGVSETLGSHLKLPSGYKGVGHRVHPHLFNSEGFFIAKIGAGALSR